MWDHALTVLSSIVIIVVGSVVATFILRRFERGRIPFSIPLFKRPSIPTIGAASLTGWVLYVTGAVAVALGCLLIIPTMSRVAQFGDAILLLGAPMVMNGITLVFYGIVVLALGKIVHLLSRSWGRLYAAPMVTSDSASTDPDSRVLVACPNCGKQMRIPTGNTGLMKCPRCATGFDIQQAVI
jgi:hypothetical protein